MYPRGGPLASECFPDHRPEHTTKVSHDLRQTTCPEGGPNRGPYEMRLACGSRVWYDKSCSREKFPLEYIYPVAGESLALPSHAEQQRADSRAGQPDFQA